MKREYKPTIVHPVQFSPWEKIAFKNKDIFNKQTSQLKGLYNLAVIKPPSQRSPQWNKYYWGVVIGERFKEGTPANFFGADPLDLHEEFKEFFNHGESTADLSNEDFENYIKKIQILLAVGYELIIPDPNQVMFLG